MANMISVTTEIRNIVVNTLGLTGWPFFGLLTIEHNRRKDGTRRLSMSVENRISKVDRKFLKEQLIMALGSQIKSISFPVKQQILRHYDMEIIDVPQIIVVLEP